MSEDLSAQVRLGVSYVMLSTITVFVVTAIMVGTTVLSSMLNTVTVNVGYVQQGPLESSSGKIMSGAGCYRLMKDVEGAVYDFEIEVTTGGSHKYYDVEDLMKNDLMKLNFYVNSWSDDGATWVVHLKEVD